MMEGYLTTHVLDTTQGIPASHLTIQVWALATGSEKRTLLKTVQTTPNGRTEEPLLVGEEFVIGSYELLFEVGNYFALQSIPTAHPPFLNEIPIRFGVADATTHYHVPLLVSPWAYSTYRGS